jgi:hypothetical protein
MVRMTAWPAAGTFPRDLNDGGEIRGWGLEAGDWRRAISVTPRGYENAHPA